MPIRTGTRTRSPPTHTHGTRNTTVTAPRSPWALWPGYGVACHRGSPRPHRATRKVPAAHRWAGGSISSVFYVEQSTNPSPPAVTRHAV